MERRGSQKKKRLLIEKQNGLCYYCNQEFGSIVWCKGRTIVLRAEIEHVVPFVYCHCDNMNNLVVACHVCNRAKHDKVFNNMGDLLTYLQNKWDKYKRGVICSVNNAEESLLEEESGNDFVVKSAETHTITNVRNKSSVLPVECYLAWAKNKLRYYGFTKEDIQELLD